MSKEITDKPLITQAMIKINQILEEYNLAGFIVLHSPGQCKYLAKIDPTYSCVKVGADGMLGFPRDLNAHFGGNKAAMEERIADTAEMLNSISVTTLQMVAPIVQLNKNVRTAMQQASQPAEAIIKSINHGSKQ